MSRKPARARRHFVIEPAAPPTYNPEPSLSKEIRMSRSVNKALVGFCVALLAAAIVVPLATAQSPEDFPKPQKEHQWLQQLAGNWEYDAEMIMEPGQPPMKATGTETGRMIGGFWAMMENKGEFMGTPFTGIMTLGYDPEKKKYVGSWIDNMTSYMWHYQGTLDSSGKVLTLDTEGPCPQEGGRIVRFKEVVEMKGPNQKVFTSAREKDGKWITHMKITSRRKK
jgi:hypothetical protein